MDLENENRIVTTSEMNGDSEIEYSLRPKRLAEYIGQKKAKENLKIYIEALNELPPSKCCCRWRLDFVINSQFP